MNKHRRANITSKLFENLNQGFTTFLRTIIYHQINKKTFHIFIAHFLGERFLILVKKMGDFIKLSANQKSNLLSNLNCSSLNLSWFWRSQDKDLHFDRGVHLKKCYSKINCFFPWQKVEATKVVIWLIWSNWHSFIKSQIVIKNVLYEAEIHLLLSFD